MTSTLMVAGLVGLLLAAAPAAAQSPAPPAGVLIVRGSATVSQKPDLAHLSLSVVTIGPTLVVAARDHAARAARAGSALAQWASQGAAVDEGSFSLVQDNVPEPESKAPGKSVMIYRAETRYDVTVTAIDRLDAIVAGIVGTGLFEVGPTSFSVADETAAVDHVRRAAMADALHQAEIYAEAGSVRLDGIERIADGEASGASAPPAMSMKMARSATVGLTPPKTLTFQGSVAVTWRIAPR
ncbi:MAG: SIMPL domain-containing protein [Janthinobacterium lividum]